MSTQADCPDAKIFFPLIALVRNYATFNNSIKLVKLLRRRVDLSIDDIERLLIDMEAGFKEKIDSTMFLKEQCGLSNTDMNRLFADIRQTFSHFDLGFFNDYIRRPGVYDSLTIGDIFNLLKDGCSQSSDYHKTA